LDVIWCNDSFIISDVIFSTPFSVSDDHCAVSFEILGTSRSSTLPVHELRDFFNADWNSISEFLSHCDWHTVFSDCISCENFVTVFYAKLNEAIASFVSLKVFKPTTSPHQLSYPHHIRKLYRTKTAIWRRFKQFKTLVFKQQYAAISSRCREAVYNYVAKREENIINSGNLGKFFRYANSKFSHKSSVGPLMDANGNKTIDPEVKASLLSQYFQSQFTTDNHILPDMQPPSAIITGISSNIFTPSLVSGIIRKLNARSAGGPDGIPPSFLKKACASLSHPLAFLFQIFLNEGFVPTIWRKAYITSIFKKGDSTLPSNYRPISLTCCICKIMESIIKDQLVAYLHSKGLISKHQHAFIKKHSTVTNLLECTHDWAVSLHGGVDVDVVYVDFSRAFDSIVHSKLIYKLTKYGISGCLLMWINAFLTDRHQCVIIEHCFSEWSPVISGVPQGSVLGPILFIMYIDDIFEVFLGSAVTHQLFADDLKLFSTVKTSANAASLQSTLDRLQQWCTNWQLNINTKKCFVLHLGKTNSQIRYTLDGYRINTAQNVTDFGVEIDCNFKYDTLTI
jgi:hypothetical protein